MNKEKWKNKFSSFLPVVLGFVSAAVALPYLVEWLMPSCIHTRIGCTEESFYIILLIKAGLGVLILGIFYLAFKYAPGIAGGKR